MLNRFGVKSSAKLRKRAVKQVERKLALIAKLGPPGYFLIVWDIVEFCRKNGIFVQGRVSAAIFALMWSVDSDVCRVPFRNSARSRRPRGSLRKEKK